MWPQIALGKIAGAAANQGALCHAGRGDLNQGADAVPAAARADESQSQPVVRCHGFIVPQKRGAVVGSDEQVRPAIVVDVAPRSAAPDDRLRKRPAALQADLSERAVMLVVE